MRQEQPYRPGKLTMHAAVKERPSSTILHSTWVLPQKSCSAIQNLAEDRCRKVAGPFSPPQEASHNLQNILAFCQSLFLSSRIAKHESADELGL